MNNYILCEIHLWPYTTGDQDFVLGSSLLEAIKLTKISDPDKYEYSGYGIGFVESGSFWVWWSGFGKNVINLLQVRVNQCILIIKKDTLILGKDPTHGLEDIALPQRKNML